MSAIQEISEHVEKFQGKVKEAKEAQHLTIEQLAEQSGVPYSVIGRISSGAHPDPKLINAAALAMTLGLSLDELCGLAAPQPADAELVEKYHAIELENVELRGENSKLRAVDQVRVESIATQKPILYGAAAFIAFSAAMAIVLLAYLIGDASHPTIGLIKFGELTAPAVAIILLLVAAFCNAAMLGYRIYKHRRNTP